MKKLLLGLALAAVTSVTSQAGLIWIDLDQINMVLAPGGTYTATFDIAAGDGGPFDVAGFVPGSDVISSAIVGFDLITTGGTPISASYVLDGGSGAGVGSGNLVFIMGGAVTVLIDLSADGILSYTVKNTGATSVELNSAGLIAASAVSDGGSTVMLLGSTLMGMAALARRKK